MGYWPHLTHAFHQSNRLIAVAIKSYIHGIFPLWFKADGPKTIIRIYHEIRRIKHINRLAQAMEKELLPEYRNTECKVPANSSHSAPCQHSD